VAAGYWLDADANTYLLLGVPLTIGYQRWVARRPLHEIWVRDAERFRLDRAGVALAVLLAIMPAHALARGVAVGRVTPASLLWLLCAVAGAVAAAFALRAMRRPSLRPTLACVLVAGGIGTLLMTSAWHARGAPPPGGAILALRWLLLYFPVCFVLEEVFFRGTLDAHVSPPGRGGWTSALFVSALWGIWHLPIAPTAGGAAVVGMLVVHTLIGVPLSLYWRRSGNLVGPALAHAAIDAVRNSLMR